MTESAAPTGTESEQAWLEAALERYEGPLLRYAASVVGRAAAADVVQDTFLALCRADRDRVACRLAPWLFTVCRNRALDCLREGQRLEPLQGEDVRSPESEPGRSLENEHSLLRVQALLDSLPDKQRQALVLKFSGGLRYKEIAEVMELSVSHVGVLLHTAIGRLRASWAEPAELLALGGEP
jgi:RNA polymerase sigma factor (sigma-70 family)